MTYTSAEWQFMRQRLPRTYSRLWAEYQNFERQQRFGRQKAKQRKSAAPRRRRDLVNWFNRARHCDVCMLRLEYWNPHPNPHRIDPKPFISRMDIIRKKVSELSGFSLTELSSKRRNRDLSTARQAISYLAAKHTKLSLPSIGRYLGRHHSTIIHSIRTVEANPERYAKYVNPVTRYLEEKGE